MIKNQTEERKPPNVVALVAAGAPNAVPDDDEPEMTNELSQFTRGRS